MKAVACTAKDGLLEMTLFSLLPYVIKCFSNLVAVRFVCPGRCNKKVLVNFFFLNNFSPKIKAVTYVKAQC